MRRLNFKLLAGLVIVGALLAVGAYGLHRVQVRRTSRALLATAARAEARGELDQARAALSRYLALRPADTDTLARFAQLVDQGAATPQERFQSVLALEQVLRLAPERQDVRRRLVRAALGLGRAADAQAHLDFLQQSSPEDGELDFLQGCCDEVKGEPEQAAECYQRALKHDPRRCDASERLAHLLRARLDAPERADRVIDAMVAANPDSPRALLDRARYRTQFRLAGADEDLNHARLIAPDDADVIRESAREAQARGAFEDARRLLTRGRSLQPRDARIVEALAALEVRAGRPDEAVTCLRHGVEEQPDQVGLRWALAHLLAQRGATTELDEQTDRLRLARFAPGPLGYLAAYRQVNGADWQKARTLLEELQPSLAAWPELLARSNDLLGRCYGRLGDLDRQCDAYRNAVRLNPQWITPRLGLAATLATQGKTDQAIAEYRALVSQAPEARLPLARLLIAQNGRRPAEQRHWDEAEALLDALAKEDPAAVAPQVSRAALLEARGQRDGARALLREAATREPRTPEPWLALAHLAGRESGPDAALSVLNDALAALGDRAPIRLARAEVLAARPGTAEALREQARGLEQFSDDDQRALRRGLAAAFYRAGEPKEAERLYRAWADRDPMDLSPRLALFDLAFQAGDAPAMTRLVAEVRRIEGDGGTLGPFSEARRLLVAARQGDSVAREAARKVLTDLAAKRPHWPLVPLALAELDDQAGNRDSALKHGLRAIELGENSPQTLQRVARLLFAARRYDEADQLLRQLPDDGPMSDDLQRLATGVALQNHDPSRAVALARKAVADHPDDYRERLWLGHVLWAAGRRDESEAALSQAVAQAGTAPEAWIALIQCRARLGKTAQAEAALREAEHAVPKEQAALVMARGHEALDHAGQARRYYDQALAARPDDEDLTRLVLNSLIRTGQAAEAETRLRALLKRETISPNQADWARHTLAVLLTIGNDYRRARAALTLIDGGRETPDDLRARARVLVAQRTRSQRREAIAVLERLDQGGRLETADRFLLAQLLDRDGDWPKAQGHWQRVLDTQPRNPLYLAEFAAALRRHGQAAEARLLAEQLEQIEPRSYRTLALNVRLLNDSGQAGEAEDRINAQARRPGVEPGPLAALCEEIGRFAAAEVLFKKAADRPATTLAYAEFLARRDRGREALDLCARLWSAGPPETAARACTAVLDAGKADVEQVQRVASWLEDATARHPDSTTLQVGLATVRERQGRYPEAEALYRQAIARGDGGVVPLNNLAWLVALQEGQGGEALVLVDRAIALQGPEPELLDTRAVALLALGRTERAIEDLNEAVAARPSAPLFFHLAQAHLKAHDPNSAAEALGRAKRAGLSLSGLHPLEQLAYQRVVRELDGR